MQTKDQGPGTKDRKCARGRRLILGSLVLGLWSLVSFAADAESLAERSLKQIGERQREIFAEAAKQGENLDDSMFKRQLQTLVHEYELLLRNNPKFAAGYAAYGFLLSKV